MGRFDLNNGQWIPTWPTLWNTVSDLTNKKVWVGHNMSKTTYYFDMKKLNFKKGAPILRLKLDTANLAGEVSRYFTKEHDQPF